MDEDDNENSVTFSPPLYIQRYRKAEEILGRHSQHLQSILDFGCAECKFFERICRSDSDSCFPHLQRMVGFDLEESVLSEASENLQPIPFDFLSPKSTQLKIYLISKNILMTKSLPHFDAVTCIEVIEHLDVEFLKDLVHVVFTQIRPFVLTVTTQNKDFNPIFGMDSLAVRHPEHLFEWSRQEFQAECEYVRKLYPEYCLKFDGVGLPPKPGDVHVGFCTQIAVFEMREPSSLETLGNSIEEFASGNALIQIEYPLKREEAPLGERLLAECQYYVRFASKETQDWVSIDSLTQFDSISQLCPNPKDLAKFLSDSGWRVDFENMEVNNSFDPEGDCTERECDTTADPADAARPELIPNNADETWD